MGKYVVCVTETKPLLVYCALLKMGSHVFEPLVAKWQLF